MSTSDKILKTSEAILLCMNCKHLSPKEIVVYPQCTRPELVKQFGIDFIHGSPLTVSARAMRDARYGVACGVEAKFFESKETPKPPPLPPTATSPVLPKGDTGGPKDSSSVQPASSESQVISAINK